MSDSNGGHLRTDSAMDAEAAADEAAAIYAAHEASSSQSNGLTGPTQADGGIDRLESADGDSVIAGSTNADSLEGEETGSKAGTASKREEKDRKKREKKEKEAEEKARKKAEKDTKKSTGRMRMDGMIDKAIRMLSPITRDGRKTINSAIKDQVIPSFLIRSAKGLAFLTIAKAGLVWGFQGGLGIMVGRKPDGSWSPPCAFQYGGVSCGALIGASVVDLMLVINTEEQLKVLTSKGMIKLGGDLEVTIGPLGRNAQAALAAGNKGVAACYAYSFSKGIYGGISLQGGAIWPYSGENSRFYGRDVKVQDLFLGQVEVPEGPQRELVENFNATLAKMSELTVRRPSSHNLNDAQSSSGDATTTRDETEEAPEVVVNYLKERGE